MATLTRELRRSLENTVSAARRAAEAGARKAIEQLAVHHHEPYTSMTLEQRELRNALRAHGRQLGDRLDTTRGNQAIKRLAAECAYEHWHRMLFARFLAENNLLIEPDSGMDITLEDCRELSRQRGVDWLELASAFAQRMLPQIFRSDNPVLVVSLPPESLQELTVLLEKMPVEIFTATDSLGWVYQFWQSDSKDEVNASGDKIGADELPSVTQLFTEDYMVDFLLDNTIGAWHAGKSLAANPKLAESATSENELRAAVALPGCTWKYLRFIKGNDGKWTPAAGTFDAWPKSVTGLRCLDPCMGSGHFVVAMFDRLVALRMREEAVDEVEAVAAVIRDNLFGLEIDPRCTQIGAFNLALAAWRRLGHCQLPAMNLACSGLAPNAKQEDWLKLAGESDRLQRGMERLYALFKDAPTLGSLINPLGTSGDLVEADFHELQPLLGRAFAMEAKDDAAHEMAVTALGLAKAAEILSGRFTLIATNFPYLKRGNQADVLKEFSTLLNEHAHAELATTFLVKALDDLEMDGTLAVVTPQSLTYQRYYVRLRKKILEQNCLRFIAKLGPGAFDTISGEIVQPILLAIDKRYPSINHKLAYADFVREAHSTGKAIALRDAGLVLLNQLTLLESREHKISSAAVSAFPDLADYCDCFQGICTGDIPRFGACFWEVPREEKGWVLQHSTPENGAEASGCTQILFWQNGAGVLHEQIVQRLGEAGVSSWIRGLEAWGSQGVAIAQMQSLRAGHYTGTCFDSNTAVVIPKDQDTRAAVFEYCRSDEYRDAVLEIDQSIKISNKTLLKVPFDLAYWRTVAEAKYPNGLPKPFSSDPTQWLFDGHPATADQPLHVAVARLLGYQWPRQTGSNFPDCPAIGPDGLEQYADSVGIVSLKALRGVSPAADRLASLLGDAFDREWSSARLANLLADVEFGGKTLDDWLHDGFFMQHCALFHQRPFLWHVWDGRRDGFHAIVNYHKLTGAQGKRTLETLIYTYLGDWIDQQRAEQKAGVEGADARLTAAEHLKSELVNILNGEPPYDLFVRWKPLGEQAVGWEPDINDGVRMNIRPFTNAKPFGARGRGASILRVTPKIKWEKDRGKEPQRPKEDFPWFWGWDETTNDFSGGKTFDGNRWNDLHLTRAFKEVARTRAKK